MKCQVSVSEGRAWHFSVVFVIFGGPIWRLSWMANMQIPLKCEKTIFSLEIINFFKENNLLFCLYTYLYLINYWELFLRLRSERKAKLAWVLSDELVWLCLVESILLHLQFNAGDSEMYFRENIKLLDVMVCGSCFWINSRIKYCIKIQKADFPLRRVKMVTKSIRVIAS